MELVIILLAFFAWICCIGFVWHIHALKMERKFAREFTPWICPQCSQKNYEYISSNGVYCEHCGYSPKDTSNK